MSARIDLHIERLVLEGLPVDGHHAPYVRAAVESELARLLSQRGLTPELMAGGAQPRLAAGSIDVTPGVMPPVQLGDRIASAVHAGLSGERAGAGASASVGAASLSAAANAPGKALGSSKGRAKT